jgi:uncharacterized protein DUF4340
VNNKLVLLTAVLVLQLVLVLLFRMQSQPTTDDESVMLSFEPSQVEGITLSDGNLEVSLTRIEDGWQVGGYPADADKVSSMLEKLAALDTRWPVATTPASAVRFEVAQDNFQRRVILDGVDDLAALYLGTSPGFQKVHGRRADSDSIYSIGLSNFELPANIDGWLDKKLFALDEAPTSITLTPADPDQPAQNLVKTQTGWLYNGAAADTAVATTYSNRFTTLQIAGVTEQAPEDLVEQARIDLVNEAEQKQVTISRLGDSDDYYISAAGEPALFSLATYIAEQLLMTDVDFSAADSNEEAESLQGDD